MDWYGFKESMVAVTHLDMDALHVHAGLLVQLLAAFLLRRSLRSPWPLLVVLVAALANEAYDIHYDTWPDPYRERQWLESTKDVINTMLMPGVLFLLARFAPSLLSGESERVADSPELAPQRPFP